MISDQHRFFRRFFGMTFPKLFLREEQFRAVMGESGYGWKNDTLDDLVR